LAAELKENYPDAQIDLLPSGGGRFEVLADGQPIFEKSKTGRHALPGEVLELLQKKQ
jgi:selenoprotein W-related protein